MTSKDIRLKILPFKVFTVRLSIYGNNENGANRTAAKLAKVLRLALKQKREKTNKSEV